MGVLLYTQLSIDFLRFCLNQNTQIKWSQQKWKYNHKWIIVCTFGRKVKTLYFLLEVTFGGEKTSSIYMNNDH